jgi:hypothetical protein
MVPGLQEINSVIAHEINDAMLLRQSPRPTAKCKILERFGLAIAIKRVTQNQFKGTQSEFSISLDPVAPDCLGSAGSL